MIRLADLDPPAVARDVVALVTHHVWKVTFQIDPSLPLVWPSPLENTGLGLAVQELTRYAQEGRPHCDDAGGPREYLQTVAEALFSAAHPSVYQGADIADVSGMGEPEHAIDVVLRAAVGRETVDAKIEHVPLGWLACLAGIPVANLRVYAGRGELAVSKGRVAPGEALRWLSGRGVPGFR